MSLFAVTRATFLLDWADGDVLNNLSDVLM